MSKIKTGLAKTLKYVSSIPEEARLDAITFFNTLVRSHKKAFTLKGRASRLEYWNLFFYNFVLAKILTTLTSVDYQNYFGETLYLALSIPIILVSFWSGLAQVTAGIRRLHDINRSAIWLPLFIVILSLLWVLPTPSPISILVSIVVIIMTSILIYWYAKAGDPSTNSYGPPPS